MEDSLGLFLSYFPILFFAIGFIEFYRKCIGYPNRSQDTTDAYANELPFS